MNKIDLDKLLQGRQPKDLDELNKILQEEMHLQNNAPRPEFCGISSHQMRFLLYDPFVDGSTFGFKDIDPAVLNKCPFFLLAENMLRLTVLTTNPFKLTSSTAALPVKVVQALYEQTTLKDELIDSGTSKLYKETDSNHIHVCKIVLELAGIVRKQQGKWHLTQKGQKLSQPTQRAVLFQEIFQSFALKYNWAYLDGYNHPQAGQMAFAFSLSILAHFGKIERPISFYPQKYLEAFPTLLEEVDSIYKDNPKRALTNCFVIRFFSRFAVWWGLVEMVEPFDIFSLSSCPVQKSELLEEVFRMPSMEG